MKQLTNLEKKVRRRIAKASKRGRYLVTRRGRRDRPGRKKKGISRCPGCDVALGKYYNYSICNECLAKREEEKKHLSMAIPKMSEK